MWPYTIRLNPVQISLTIFAFLCLYLLYSSTNLVRREFLAQRTKGKQVDFMDFADRKVDEDLLPMDEVNLKELLVTLITAAELGGHQVENVRKMSNKLGIRSKGKTREGLDDPLTQGDLRSHHVMVHGLSATFPGLRIISEENHSETEDERIVSIQPFQVDRQKMMHFDHQIQRLPADVRLPYGDLVVWIDPLDATKEYTENLLEYVTTMACLTVNGVPQMGIIHKPFTKETYWAWVGHGMSENLLTLVRNRTLHDYHPRGAGEAPLRLIVSRSHAGNVHGLASKAFHDHQLVIVPAGGSGYKAMELVGGRVDAYVHATRIKKWDVCAPNAILNALQGGRLTTLRGEAISYNYDDQVVIENGLLATIGQEHSRIAKDLADALLTQTNH